MSLHPPGNYTVGYNPPLLGQLGHDIDGEAVNDFSGNALATNGTGNRVVVGAYGNDGNGSSDMLEYMNGMAQLGSAGSRWGWRITSRLWLGCGYEYFWR